VAAGYAGVFAELAARTDEREPVAEQHARERMAHERSPIRLVDEAMAAVACVLDSPTALSHAMHAVAEQPA
jgi:hypothetical protein